MTLGPDSIATSREGGRIDPSAAAIFPSPRGRVQRFQHTFRTLEDPIGR